MKNSLNWEQFKVSNTNFTDSFEDLCRILFKRQFFTDDTIFLSKPNNPGTEIEPMYSNKTNSRISFQAKFLSTNNYYQIKNSTDKVIEYYRNNLDTLYLYCNRELDINSNAFLRISNSLNEANIDIILITNHEILDQVLRYDDLCSYFFNKHMLDRNWFKYNCEKSIHDLGPRYNSDLNENTTTEDYINLFVKDDESITLINNKKITLQKNLLDLSKDTDDPDVLKSINERLKAVNEIKDINYYTLKDCIDWAYNLETKFIDSNDYIKNELSIIEDEKEKIYDKYKLDNLEGDYYTKLNKLYEKANNLENILYFYKALEFTDYEKSFINNKFVIMTGEAGTGKSHLLGNTCRKIINNGDYAILFLGHTFINNSGINIQIMENLGLNYSFDKFLDVLEFIGSDRNRDVYIFIDAINESKYREIWKNGLSLLFESINKRKFLKLIISIKNGYENSVLEGNIKHKIEENKIAKVEHRGFIKNSIETTRNFFDYYNITFSPSDYLSFELTNPLFLTLYCKSYSHGELNIFKIFKNIIDRTYLDVKEKLNIEEDNNILIELLIEMASLLYINNDTLIKYKDLCRLEFWKLYDLRALNIIPILVKNGILIDYSISDEVYYGFSYNLLGDYLQAKYIIKNSENIDEIIESINYLLQIENGEIKNTNNLDLFNFVCSMFFSKFGIDPIKEIISKLNDENSKNILIDKYIEGHSIRSSDSIDIQSFKEIVGNNPINIKTLFKVLIENSLKINNELNSEYLHNILFNLELNQRDSMWSVYINQLSYDEIRLYQIIKYLIRGEKIRKLGKEEIKLLIILLTWLLSSSNRYLRDNASKALIEILKDSYGLCVYILRKFEYINDPYIIQRLYGCVFGACTKNFVGTKHEFKELAEYVYDSIFNQEFVYPDILLRDYARLIVEKYLSTYGCKDTIITKNKIFPPYRSIDIPIVSEDEYYDKTLIKNNGLNSIDLSMHPDVEGLGYGDFGRYVFQTALSYFEDVNILNLYHYAMQYIIKDLGYTNDLFGKNDRLRGISYRHSTKKVERIGKKYQWIAFYNILARLSDHSKLKDDYNDGKKFIGPWNPCVRDFDPTINMRIVIPENLKPKFTIDYKEDFISEEEKDEYKIDEWKKMKANMFNEALIQTDNENTEWVILYSFKDVRSEPDIKTNELKYNRSGAQNIWRISQGYFIKEEEFGRLKELIKNKNFWGRWFPEGASYIYSLFNREYYWSSAYKDELADEWLEYNHDTGRIKERQMQGMLPKIEGDYIIFEQSEWIKKEPVLEKVADILPAFHHYSWEGEYDATQEDTQSFYVPCKKIVDHLKIQQNIYDGYFYNSEGKLIAYDSKESEISNRFLIRKDYLDKFLEENDYILFWTNIGEKRYNIGLDNLAHSKRSGFNWYSKGEYYGDMSIQDD